MKKVKGFFREKWDFSLEENKSQHLGRFFGTFLEDMVQHVSGWEWRMCPCMKKKKIMGVMRSGLNERLGFGGVGGEGTF